MSNLVVNPEVRFCHITAQIVTDNIAHSIWHIVLKNLKYARHMNMQMLSIHVNVLRLISASRLDVRVNNLLSVMCRFMQKLTYQEGLLNVTFKMLPSCS